MGFQFGESPAKHSLSVLDFPNLGIELSGSGSSTIVDVSKRFASEFLLKREKLIVPQAPEPNTDFQWKTMFWRILPLYSRRLLSNKKDLFFQPWTLFTNIPN